MAESKSDSITGPDTCSVQDVSDSRHWPDIIRVLHGGMTPRTRSLTHKTGLLNQQKWLTITGILPVTEPTPSWQIEFYERQEDGCPVQDFLNALDKPPRAKMLALIRLLAEQGPTLPFPYSSQV